MAEPTPTDSERPLPPPVSATAMQVVGVERWPRLPYVRMTAEEMRRRYSWLRVTL